MFWMVARFYGCCDVVLGRCWADMSGWLILVVAKLF